MGPPLDTSPAVHALQLRLYRKAGPGRRVEIAAELSEALREISRSGVRARSPGLSEEEVAREVLEIFYGHAGSAVK